MALESGIANERVIQSDFTLSLTHNVSLTLG